MKRTSPWFILLFPIAIPAMIVLDFFGYRIIALIILVALVLSFACYVYAVFTKFRSLREGFVTLAEAVCDPGSWSIRHYPYHHTLSGAAGTHRFHYSLLGHDERAMFQLFLECPVGRYLFLEAGEDPAQHGDESPQVRAVLQIPGFRSLTALPRKVPFFRRFLGGFAGSGGPGLVLRKQVDDPFSPPAVKRDLALLLDVARVSADAPRQEKEGT
ncbi:MAG TPA: hypothetical protein VFG28_01645 [Syntrophales bacterium]|nr:hypothetical protein [Syntrophales bacterium]